MPVVLLTLLLASCSVSPRFRTGGEGGTSVPTRDLPVTGTERIQTGIASYYADQYHGRPTASGEIFDMHKLSAAHRTLPLGTRVRVTNLRNKKTIELIINDRGPFIKGRILDVSYRAAQELDFVAEGTTPVRIEVLEYGAGR
jgi:rare lipoprotein A